MINLEGKILYHDKYIMVVDKPHGLMVEPDRNQNPNLLNEVKRYIGQTSEKQVYAQHIHRLDRPVTGVVLFAIDKSVLKNLNEQFAQRNVKKFYKAKTISAPANMKGELFQWHRKEKKKAVLYDNQIEYSDPACLYYEVKPDGNKFLWDIELFTGRYHQIRGQLASIGCAIIGDKIYGSTEVYKENSIALQAYRLEFLHPVSNDLIIVEAKGNI
ncbi:MAG: RluA family pseudouridine synthase [Cytophagaceae bacterium]